MLVDIHRSDLRFQSRWGNTKPDSRTGRSRYSTARFRQGCTNSFSLLHPRSSERRPFRRSSKEAFAIEPTLLDREVRGLSARSIRYTHAVLRSGLKQAVRWKLLLANSADLVDLPRHNRRNVGVLNVEQAKIFMAAITGHPYEALFALAMTTGMRPSEYLALTWADIDLDR